MTSFEKIQSYKSHVSDPVWAVPPDFLLLQALMKQRYRTLLLPTELGGWLGRVIIPPHHTATSPIIATPAPVWYHKKAMDP